MGNSSGLAVLALIIGIGALGLGIFTFYTGYIASDEESDSEATVHRTYTDYREAQFTSTVQNDWSTISGININFKVEKGECVYFIFTCKARLFPVGNIAYMNFRLNIDGVEYYNASTTVGLITSSATSYYYSVAFQYADYSLSAGSHEVTVETMRQCDGEIENCFLLVQCLTSTSNDFTFIPFNMTL